MENNSIYTESEYSRSEGKEFIRVIIWNLAALVQIVLKTYPVPCIW